MYPAIRLSPIVTALLLVAFARTGAAQDLFTVTGVSPPATATLEAAGGPAEPLSVGRAVTPGILRVAAGAQLMLFDPTGVVCIVAGPATTVVSYDEATDTVRIELREGKLVFVVARAAGEGRPIVVTATAVEQPRFTVEVPIPPGRTLVSLAGGRLGVAYLGDGAATPLSIRVNEGSVSLPPGQLLTVDAAGKALVGPIGDWIAEQGLGQSWGRMLGVASALAVRPDVDISLYRNIIAWDRYAGAAYVSARLPEYRFSPEIRQVVQTVTVVNQPVTKGGAVRTVPFNAANEVPALSPAAASVQNIRDFGEGVTAVLLNLQASALLQVTGSQGLGFRGLEQLAIAGFGGTGIRTVGPAGLGAQR